MPAPFRTAATGPNAVKVDPKSFDTGADFISLGDPKADVKADRKLKREQRRQALADGSAVTALTRAINDDGTVDTAKLDPDTLRLLQRKAKRKIAQAQAMEAKKASRPPKEERDRATAERRAWQAERERRQELILAGENPLDVPLLSTSPVGASEKVVPVLTDEQREARRAERKAHKKERKANERDLKLLKPKDRQKLKTEQNRERRIRKHSKKQAIAEIMAVKGIPQEALDPSVTPHFGIADAPATTQVEPSADVVMDEAAQPEDTVMAEAEVAEPEPAEPVQVPAPVIPEPEPAVEKPAKAKKAKRSKTDAAAVPAPVSSASPADVSAFLQTNRITYEPADVAAQLPPYLDFEDLQVAGGIRGGLKAFQKPTPIQSAVWPVLLSGRDVIGIAETGSGKTFGFGVPAIQHLQSYASKSVSCLVIAPTRELAMQTDVNLAELGSHLSPPIKTICVYGGVDKKAQVKSLKKDKPRIVVGTPGRLLDLANEGALELGQVSYLVLDEADRMLDKGFENDIRAIIKLCLPNASPASPFALGSNSSVRLTAMFSATWPMSVRRLAQDFLNEPARVLVGSDELAASNSVHQTVIVVDDGREKERLLVDQLRKMGFNKPGKGPTRDKCLVFALYKKEAQRLYGSLQRKGYQVGCLEGDMSQAQRTEALADFRAGKTNVLVATDVAARGLDISNVEAVLNVTFPLTIEDYVHRIGRTGRAGRKGVAVTFFTDEDKAHAGELMRVLKDSGNSVPEEMNRFPTTIKKASHPTFGAHYREIDPSVKGTKKVFT